MATRQQSEEGSAQAARSAEQPQSQGEQHPDHAVPLQPPEHPQHRHTDVLPAQQHLLTKEVQTATHATAHIATVQAAETVHRIIAAAAPQSIPDTPEVLQPEADTVVEDIQVAAVAEATPEAAHQEVTEDNTAT